MVCYFCGNACAGRCLNQIVIGPPYEQPKTYKSITVSSDPIGLLEAEIEQLKGKNKILFWMASSGWVMAGLLLARIICD